MLVSSKTLGRVQSFWRERPFLPAVGIPGLPSQAPVRRRSPGPRQSPPPCRPEGAGNACVAGTGKRRKIPGALEGPLWTDEMVQYDALNSSSSERK